MDTTQQGCDEAGNGAVPVAVESSASLSLSTCPVVSKTRPYLERLEVCTKACCLVATIPGPEKDMKRGKWSTGEVERLEYAIRRSGWKDVNKLISAVGTRTKSQVTGRLDRYSLVELRDIHILRDGAVE